MAATVQVAERNGAPAGVETVDPDNINMGSDDSAELNPATYPVTAQADGHAFEKWLRLYVTAMGGSTVIDNIKIWLSSLGGGWKTGEGMSTNMREAGYVSDAYAQPVESDSGKADQAMLESEPAGPNLGIGGALGGNIGSAPNYTDYCVCQLDVTGSTPAGSLNQKTFTFQWDEQ